MSVSIADLSFVWPSRSASGLADLAAATGTGVILDCRTEAGSEVVAAVGRVRVADVLLTLDEWRDSAIAGACRDAGISHAWIDCSVASAAETAGDGLEALGPNDGGVTVIPIVSDLALLDRLVSSPAFQVVALKGNEASGFVSGETAHVLLAIAEKARRAAGRDTEFVIWGGLATPEATSAYLATGARGAVFESVHWLTDEMGLDAALQQSIRGQRAESSRVVGARAGFHCRLFDKGNSRAVRTLAQMLLRGVDPASADGRAGLVRQITGAWVQPLDSEFGADQIVPIGPEASFAAAFVERHGRRARQALAHFRDEVAALCATAKERVAAVSSGPVCRELGTKYPIVQGAMSWITDHAEFAKRIAESGALPTLALGMRSRRELDRDFAGLPATLDGRPYAVNLIVLPENPVRDEQLAWIEATRPPFVVIAAGDPSFARRLTEQGLRVLYVASDEGLIRVALEAGVRYLIVEGNEAGGHVGPHSLTTVAQGMHELKRRQPALFAEARLVLAGGIYDAATASRAILLGGEGVQMGTAYLATDEAVATGALSALYRKEVCEARPGCTLVLGEPLGLRIRSLRSPKTERLADIERHFGDPGNDERELRRGVESEATGTLLIAARGVRRPGGPPLAERECRDEGQFMSGANAGCIDEVRTLAALHAEVMTDAAENRETLAGPPAPSAARARPAAAPRHADRIAITAMAMANALGNSLDEIWDGVVTGRNGITAIPPTRWDHAAVFDPRPGTPGKTYSNAAALLNLEIDRQDIGVPPQDFRTMAKSTRLTLWLARQVIEQATLLDSGIAPERIGVMIAQNSGEAASTLADLTITMSAPRIAQEIAEELGLTPEQAAAVERRLYLNRLTVDDTTLLGRLNCTAGGFVCNKYGFMGPSYAVTAACSTSLVALYNAVHLIRAGSIDAALVGGGEEYLSPAHFIEFAAVGALAGMAGRDHPIEKASRPFDLERDGMVLGEGGVMIVVERESVARARGARILAYVTGVGASNNITGMVESSADTQQIAIANAYADAGYAPETVDLVECHATSTAQGDVQEVQALKTFFPSGRRTALTSFKSQIGHTLGASGLTSLVRGVAAMQRRTLPPTINYETPDPAIDLEGWGFEVSGTPRDWPEPSDRPRRFEVNAFGFGGSNYVTLLEESSDDRGVVFVSGRDGREMRLLPADVSRHDLHGVLLVEVESPEGALRAAVADPEREPREQALSRLRQRIEPAGPDKLFALARQGVFAVDAARPVAPLAFVYPGQGSQYVGMGRELASAFPVVREALERMAAVADFDLIDMLFRGGEELLRNTRWQQPALFALQFALTEFFRSCGVEPAAVAGHSLGETTALSAGGVLSWEDGFRLVTKRGQVMERLTSSGIDGGAMLAVNMPIDELRQKMASRPSLVISNDNSPRQIVVGGDTSEIADLHAELEKAEVWARRLRVSMAFHTPRSRPLVDEIEPFLETLEVKAPRLPILVNSNNGIYPDDPAEIRRLIRVHLVSGVRWRENVERMAGEFGARVFLELGPKDVLSNLVSDTLPSALAISTAMPNAELATTRSALARLAALGHVHSTATPLRLVVRDDGDGAGGFDGRGAGHAGARAGGSRQAAGRREVKQESPFVEAVIALIMEATGYERHEIATDMDIRQDLSIRSSRLPVIIDAAERRFGIRVQLEELIEVRTVGDLAAALQKMAERAGAEPGTVPAGEKTTIEPEAAPRAGAKAEDLLTSRLPVQRFTWKAVPLAVGAPSPVVLDKGARVVILSWNRPSALAAGIREWFSKQYRAKSEEVVLGVEALGALAPEAIESEIARRAPGLASAAGLLITTDGLAAAPTGASAVAPAMTAAFAAFKTLLASPDREFAVVVDPGVGGAASAISEGLLGLLLSASHEYSSAVFRHATVESGAALPEVLDRCLDTSLPIVALRFRGGEVLTDEAGPDPLPVRPESRFRVGSGDVILVTGGARGITGRAAAALAPFGPRLILLGRTPLDPAADLGALLGAPGIDAEYWTCDVSQPAEVDAVVARAVERFGRIDGIVHGAGVLRDTLLDYMGVADFAAVAAVKVAGLAALLGAAEKHGLRYVVGFSSLAAVTGNAGQANYAASSRAMAGLVRAWAGEAEGRRGHTLWLPPVKDLGMASGREIREALERRGLGDAYVGVDEVGTALAHEIVLAPAARTDAIVVRMHPPVRNVKFQAAVPAARPEGEPGQAPGFDPAAYPLIDRVETLDRERGLLVARRVFRAEHDLWLPDHQPIRGMTQPILSAIMLVETVLEAARILYPHLDVIEVGDVDFLEMLECRAGADLATDVVCRASRDARGRVVCDVAVVGVPDAAEPPRADHAFRSFGARITLGGGPWQASAGSRWLLPEQCDTEAKDRAAIAGKYDTKTGLRGRYRVLEGFDGTADGLTAGHMIYAEQPDFAGRGENGYQFAPYLLESLLQVAHFYPHMRDETDERDALPMKIGRMHIGRRPALGEDVRLEGRRSAETEAGLVWELRAFSSSGEILLDLSDFLARWIAQ